MVDFVPCAEDGLVKSILVLMVVDRSCFVIGQDGRLPSPPIELLLRRLDEPSTTSTSLTAVALFDLSFLTE